MQNVQESKTAYGYAYRAVEEEKIQMGNGMDYIYLSDNEKILIETEQRNTRLAVIEQYVNMRKERGMTQAELARRAGIPRSNITRFESGTYNPSLEMLVKIAAALNMKLQINLAEEQSPWEFAHF